MAKHFRLQAKPIAYRAIMASMANELLDTEGARIKWARMRAGLTQVGLAHLVGVGNVYISQLESNTHRASRETLKKLAEALNVSRAFLELETDDPTPPQPIPADMEPVYFSPEADEIARLVDAMPAHRRAYVLNMVRLSFAHGELLDAGTPAVNTEGADSVIREVFERVSKHGSA